MKSQTIPLNAPAGDILEARPKNDTEYVFTRGDLERRVRVIKRAAGLPDDFRPLHGLRHQFTSMLASSGKVDMYALQRLLTNKSPLMTQRYVHLHDEALRRASELAGEIVENYRQKGKETDRISRKG